MKNDWTSLNNETQKLECQRCGATEPVPTPPMPILQFVDVLDGFVKRHKDCEEEKGK